jgi:hypothetical protein
MHLLRVTVLALLLLTGVGSESAAQHLSLEATPFHGTLGLGWDSGARVLGLSIGFGFPQFDYTLVPTDPDEEGDDDFLQIAHIGPFVRFAPSPFMIVDADVRLGIGELHGCSGCFPGLFYAATLSPMMGWKHLKVGPRVFAGWIREGSAPTTGIVNVTPLAVRYTISW